MSPEAWAAWAQAAVSLIAAGIALWAAFIMRATATDANDGATRRATFDHTRAVSEASKRCAMELQAGEMPGIMRAWVIGQPVGPRQVLVLDFFNAIETLVLAVENGAADRKVADRYLDDLIKHPTEVRNTIAAFRERGGSMTTWDNVERYLDAHGAAGKTLKL
jgi:hypothetical protein